MDEKIERLSDNVNDMKNVVHSLNNILENIDSRLARLEVVDSIEHRVAVNQIDLSDIKEALDRIEDVQSKLLKEMAEVKEKVHQGEIKNINFRLDSLLVKLAKAEEEIERLKIR